MLWRAVIAFCAVTLSARGLRLLQRVVPLTPGRVSGLRWALLVFYRVALGPVTVWVIADVWSWQVTMLAAGGCAVGTVVLQWIWDGLHAGHHPVAFHVARTAWEHMLLQLRGTVVKAGALAVLALTVKLGSLLAMFTYVRGQPEALQLHAALALLTITATTTLALIALGAVSTLARPTLDDTTRAYVFLRVVGASLPAYAFSLLLARQGGAVPDWTVFGLNFTSDFTPLRNVAVTTAVIVALAAVPCVWGSRRRRDDQLEAAKFEKAFAERTQRTLDEANPARMPAALVREASRLTIEIDRRRRQVRLPHEWMPLLRFLLGEPEDEEGHDEEGTEHSAPADETDDPGAGDGIPAAKQDPTTVAQPAEPPSLQVERDSVRAEFAEMVSAWRAWQTESRTGRFVHRVGLILGWLLLRGPIRVRWQELTDLFDLYRVAGLAWIDQVEPRVDEFEELAAVAGGLRNAWYPAREWELRIEELREVITSYTRLLDECVTLARQLAPNPEGLHRPARWLPSLMTRSWDRAAKAYAPAEERFYAWFGYFDELPQEEPSWAHLMRMYEYRERVDALLSHLAGAASTEERAAQVKVLTDLLARVSARADSDTARLETQRTMVGRLLVPLLVPTTMVVISILIRQKFGLDHQPPSTRP